MIAAVAQFGVANGVVFAGVDGVTSEPEGAFEKLDCSVGVAVAEAGN